MRRDDRPCVGLRPRCAYRPSPLSPSYSGRGESNCLGTRVARDTCCKRTQRPQSITYKRTFGFELRRSAIGGAGPPQYEVVLGEDGLVMLGQAGVSIRHVRLKGAVRIREQPVDGGISEIYRSDSPPSDEQEVDGCERRAGGDREYGGLT